MLPQQKGQVVAQQTFLVEWQKRLDTGQERSKSLIRTDREQVGSLQSRKFAGKLNLQWCFCSANNQKQKGVKNMNEEQIELIEEQAFMLGEWSIEEYQKLVRLVEDIL